MMTGSDQLNIVRGLVIRRNEQLHSVRVNRGTGYGQINSTPELWIRDGVGQEHRYQGDLFEAVQEGHEVAIITKQGSGNLVAVANLSTRKIHEASELTVSTTPGATLASTFGISVLLALPGLIPWVMMMSIFGLDDTAFSTTGLQIYLVILVACVFTSIRAWSKRYTERIARIRADIDRTLSADTIRASKT